MSQTVWSPTVLTPTFHVSRNFPAATFASVSPLPSGGGEALSNSYIIVEMTASVEPFSNSKCDRSTSREGDRCVVMIA